MQPGIPCLKPLCSIVNTYGFLPWAYNNGLMGKIGYLAKVTGRAATLRAVGSHYLGEKEV